MVKNSIIEEFDQLVDPDDNIRRAVNASIGSSNFTGSLQDMYRSFAEARLKEEAKLGLLRYALSNHPDLIQNVIVHKASTYKEIYKVV